MFVCFFLTQPLSFFLFKDIIGQLPFHKRLCNYRLPDFLMGFDLLSNDVLQIPDYCSTSLWDRQNGLVRPRTVRLERLSSNQLYHTGTLLLQVVTLYRTGPLNNRIKDTCYTWLKKSVKNRLFGLTAEKYEGESSACCP